MINTVTLVKQFCIYDFVERNCSKSVSLLTKDICWYGTSDHEDVYSREEARLYLKDEIEKMPSPYVVEFLEEKFLPMGQEGGVAFLRTRFSHSNTDLIIRITATSCMEDGTEKISSMHFSVADSEQQESEYFPIKKYEEKLAREKEIQLRDVIHNVPGGVCLYRWDGIKLHPLIVSDQFSNLLGEDARTRLEHTPNTAFQHVHPDDLPKLQKEIVEGFCKGTIETVYRSLNLNTNEYLWIQL